MKRYEAAARMTLPRRTYTMLRLDGRAFHTWTRGLERPYDLKMVDAMASTTVKLCEEISGVVLAYTQSDEISLLLQDFAALTTEPWFGGQVQKMVSVAASVATAHFARRFPERAPATFDARVFTVPSQTDAANALVWRQKDAMRNAVSMIAEHHFSSGQLHGVSTERRREMLADAGVNLDAADARFMMGQVVVPVTVTEPVTYLDRRTGEERRTAPVARTQWMAQAAPLLEARPGTWLAEHIPPLPSFS